MPASTFTTCRRKMKLEERESNSRMELKASVHNDVIVHSQKDGITAEGFVIGHVSGNCKPVAVGIEFGTGYSCIAFANKVLPNSIFYDAPMADALLMKAPTSLLERPDGQWKYGYAAEVEYNHELYFEPGQLYEGHLYKGFMVALKGQDSGFDTIMAVSASGKALSLMRLVITALTFLKDFAIEKICSKFGATVNPLQDVQWVLTVPATANDFGKAFMRKAAFKAGLMEKEQSDNLLLVLEPEAAALAVHAHAAHNRLLCVGNRFVVLNCGERMVDITAHEILTLEPFTAKDIATPTGQDWGDNSVSTEFKKFLVELLEPDISKGNNPFDDTFLLYEFDKIYRDFDKQKIIFDPNHDPGAIQLVKVLDYKKDLYRLANAYNAKHPDKPIVMSPVIRNGFLSLNMMLDFCEPFLYTTVNEIRRVLDQTPGIRHLVVVGDCFVSAVLKARMRSEFHNRGGVKVIFPKVFNLHHAIAHGALYFGLHKGGVTFAETNQLQEGAKLLAQAIQQGNKQWKRSKFSLLGQGRAGKTAFANAIAGRKFEETASTVGINQLTCDVKHIQASSVGGGQREQEWGECLKHVREYEAALAGILAKMLREAQGYAEEGAAYEKSDDIRAFMQTVSEAPGPSAKQMREALEVEVGTSVTIEKVRAEKSVTFAAKPPVVAMVEFSSHAGNVGSLAPVSASSARESLPAAATSDVAPVVCPIPELDEEMVMNMLAKFQDTESGLLISLFDFGGQSVFEVIHHLFLTRNGVYALLFNMEWLVNDGPDKDRALRFMRNWLSSIAVHTFNKTTQMTAPIVIVGTRLDTVTSPAAHEKISTILHEHLSDSLAWRSVIENKEGRDSNGKAFQWFFPVDNKLGKQGAPMKQLMSVVTEVIDKAEYTHKEVPLTWFKTIDQLADTQKDCLSLQEVMSAAGRCDVSEREVPLLLSFLHDMGHLMWLDEPGLRGVVILDPVSYLVVPATIIICKLTPDHEDTTHHFMDSHRECERVHKREWTLLKHDGVLSVKLLPILWEKYQKQSLVLQMLMVKFGLLVPLRSEAAGPVTQYLVPTLLAPAEAHASSIEVWSDVPYSSCYFVFTLAEELGQSSTVTEAELKSAGFLPGGMFERIVGKALSWSQDTAVGCAFGFQSTLLHKDVAVLAFGRQRFRLVHCADIHCVRVDVEGNNPVGVQQKLQDFIKRIIDECMKSLQCFPAVAFQSDAGDREKAPIGLCKTLLANELLIPLQQLREASKGESMLVRKGGRSLITLPEIKGKYGQWLQLYGLRERYDVFLSYRWGRSDSEFAEQLFDMFTNLSVGAQSRAVEVFLDRKRLQEGRLFKSDFAAALTHTLVVVPVVSVDALGRMVEHDPTKPDNVLLEWIMALESFAAGRVLKVFPILFGQRKQEDILSGSAGPDGVLDFFADNIKDSLPKITPTVTLAQAAELLRANGIEPSDKMRAYTVHSVVHELLGFLLCKASDFAPRQLVGGFADKVVRLLNNCGDAALDAVSVSTSVPTDPFAAGAPAGGVSRTLDSLTVEEVGLVLAALGLDKLIPIFAVNKVTGKLLSHCEEFADLMTEDFGVASKPVAKLLMAQINVWTEHGVSGV